MMMRWAVPHRISGDSGIFKCKYLQGSFINETSPQVICQGWRYAWESWWGELKSWEWSRSLRRGRETEEPSNLDGNFSN